MPETKTAIEEAREQAKMHATMVPPPAPDVCVGRCMKSCTDRYGFTQHEQPGPVPYLALHDADTCEFWQMEPKARVVAESERAYRERHVARVQRLFAQIGVSVESPFDDDAEVTSPR